MNQFVAVFVRRPVFATVVILSLVVVGAFSYFQLGVDRFPKVDLPTVLITTRLPGAAPEQVETEVSDKIEEAVNTISGIDELRSTSSEGVSQVIVSFLLEKNVDVAAQEVRDKVNRVLPLLPQSAEQPTIEKMDPDAAPVLSVAVTAKKPVRDITEYADKVLRRNLESVDGVGQVVVVGGRLRQINVVLDAERLRAHDLTVTDVSRALRGQNVDVPGGRVDQGPQALTLRLRGRVESPDQFGDIVVRQVNGHPVLVRDVATVEDGMADARTLANVNGVRTVLLQVRRQSGTNTVEVVQRVKERLGDLERALPPGYTLRVVRDQSQFIEASIKSVEEHLVLGSILAAAVVVMFLWNLRSTVIAAISIPTSIVATFGLIWYMGFTLNAMTMLALTLSVGIVIDDAIVVLENIFRFVEEKRMKPMEAAREATKDIGMAVLATTLSLVVIFVPVSFMSSISGRFLYQFGITAAVAVMVSLLVSFTLTPMMSSRMFSNAASEKASEGHGSRTGFYSYIDRFYTFMLRWSMAHRAAIVAIAIGVILSSIPLYRAVKQEYTPGNVDEGEFEVNITAPEGTSLSSMNEAMQAVEQELRDTPGVRTVLATAGGGFLGGVNQGSAYVRIAPFEERTFSFTKAWNSFVAGRPLDVFRGNYSQRDVVTDIRKRMRKFTHLRISVRNTSSFNFGGARFDIDFVLRGPELQQLAQYADALRLRVTGPPGGEPDIPGIVDADTTLKLDKPELRVRIDRDLAGDLGVRTGDIATALRLMVGGDDQVTRFRDESVSEDYDVQLRLSAGNRNDPLTIGRLTVPSSKGGLVRLDSLVSFETSSAPSRIDRLDRQRQVSLRASVAPGYALSDRLDALKQAARDLNMPEAYSYALTGKGRELERTFTEFLFAFMLSIAFMYMILASQFNSLIHPVTILLSLPLSIPFAMLGQWMVGDTMNLYSALGILVLFGVVKKNAILQIDHTNNLRAKGIDRLDAIVQGSRDRLRPILMTTLALVGGMLPLALGTGPGAEERRSVATVVIAGQTLSLLLTLLVTPVVYSLFDDLASTAWVRSIRRRPRRAHAAQHRDAEG